MMNVLPTNDRIDTIIGVGRFYDSFFFFYIVYCFIYCKFLGIPSMNLFFNLQMEVDVNLSEALRSYLKDRRYDFSLEICELIICRYHLCDMDNIKTFCSHIDDPFNISYIILLKYKFFNFGYLIIKYPSIYIINLLK